MVSKQRCSLSQKRPEQFIIQQNVLSRQALLWRRWRYLNQQRFISVTPVIVWSRW